MTATGYRPAAACALLMAGTALAQSYPNKTVRFIVPWPPGGGADVLSRMLSPRLSEALGQRPVERGQIHVDAETGQDRLDARGELRRTLAVFRSSQQEVVELRHEWRDREQADADDHQAHRDVHDDDGERAIEGGHDVDPAHERR